MTTDGQTQFDYPALERSADVRAEREQVARTVYAQLATVPAEFVGLGAHRWQQCRQTVTYACLSHSFAEAGRLAGLSEAQLHRVRACINRLRLVAVAPQFGETGRRIEDRVTPDQARIAELAAEARAALEVRCRAPTAHLQGTYSAPPGHVEGTWSARGAHPDETAGNTARAPARARVLSTRDESIDSIESIDRCLRAWKREDWEQIRADTIAVTRSDRFHVPHKTRRDVELVLKLCALSRAGYLPRGLLDGAVAAVHEVHRVAKPYAYLMRCVRTAADEQGIHLYRGLARVRIPATVLPPANGRQNNYYEREE